MLFTFGKCKCLHTGSGNTGVNYEMGGTILSKTVKEKDLGVTMNANSPFVIWVNLRMLLSTRFFGGFTIPWGP